MAVYRRVDEKSIIRIVLDVRRARAIWSATIDEPMDSANVSTLLEANNGHGTSSEMPLLYRRDRNCEGCRYCYLLRHHSQTASPSAISIDSLPSTTLTSITMKTPSFIALGKAVLFALPLALEVSGSDLMAVTLVPLALALRLSESKTRTAAGGKSHRNRRCRRRHLR